jgi:polyisoprenoid-binding protein YceI
MNKSVRILHISFLTALMSAGFAAHAAVLEVNAAKSSVSAIFKQMNVLVEDKFKKFAMSIDYDAAKPDDAKATVEIDTASLDLGDPEYSKEVAKKEWFNAVQFPKATFISTRIQGTAQGKLTASGNLIIKGKSTLVTFPLTVSGNSAKPVFDGVIPIKRSTYNVGEGEWKSTSIVADEVLIKFHIVTGR